MKSTSNSTKNCEICKCEVDESNSDRTNINTHLTKKKKTSIGSKAASSSRKVINYFKDNILILQSIYLLRQIKMC